REPAADHLPRLVDARADIAGGWEVVRDDPGPLLGLGVVDEGWLTGALGPLADAAAAARLDGDAVLHCDVRSDNVADLGDRVVL
ncbi:hypothetical protein Q8G47_29130, partial [Klebsiella pneumoniae]|uniref:hypothetical protein n=1 Tax=Klebsiella pneumoniae TaxID=573 RepID=UPI0030134587